jgi:hypothetical protein
MKLALLILCLALTGPPMPGTVAPKPAISPKHVQSLATSGSPMVKAVMPPMPGAAKPLPPHMAEAGYAPGPLRAPLISVLPMQQITLAWGTNSQPITGYRLYAGHVSGSYETNAFIANTNSITILIDQTKPVFMALSAYDLTGDPTNPILESALSNEAFYMPSNAPPFCMVTNGLPAVVGYGVSGKTYSVLSGPLTGITNQVADIPGTNGPWRFMDSSLARSRFYRVGSR